MKLKVVREHEIYENEIDNLIFEIEGRLNDLKYPKAYPIESMYYFEIGEKVAYEKVLDILKNLKKQIKAKK